VLDVDDGQDKSLAFWLAAGEAQWIDLKAPLKRPAMPVVCPADDIFYDGGVGVENDLFMRTVSRSLPAVSVFDAFLHRRPSQMPYAQAHAIGNANLTKAETLFAYLRDRQLVPWQ